MIKTTTRDARLGYAFQLEGETVYVKVDEASVIRTTEDDIRRCQNRSTRSSQAMQIKQRWERKLDPVKKGYKLSKEDREGLDNALETYITDLTTCRGTPQEIIQTKKDHCKLEAWRLFLRDFLQPLEANRTAQTGYRRKRTIGGILKTAAVGAAALGLTGLAGWGIKKGADAYKNADRDADREALNGSRMQHTMSEEEMREYRGGEAQQGWVMDGAAIQQGQHGQTFVETTDVHDTEEVFTTPPPVRRVRQVRNVPPPVQAPTEVVDVEDTVVESVPTTYRTVSGGTRVVEREVQVVQGNNSDVQVAALNNLGNVGVAFANAWGVRGTKVDNSVRNISITKDSGNTYTHIHDNGNDYSDRSVRVKKDSHNRTTTTVDASRRTYAPTTTTVDASRRTYAPRTTTVDRSTHVQKTQVHQRTQVHQQTHIRQTMKNQSSAGTMRIQRTKPSVMRVNSSSLSKHVTIDGQNYQKVRPTQMKVNRTTPQRTIKVNSTPKKTMNFGGSRGGSPMRRSSSGRR